MNGWLTQLLGEQGANWTLYILGGAAILVLAWIAWFWSRRVAGGVFVEGGRNRKHRLAVVDATAVDSNRRIVLVRRDDVEHLVMIGGQNDFVIESNIEREPAETAQKGQPRDRRGREAQSAAPGRRLLRREPNPTPAKAPARDEVPRPAAPASAPTPPPQPASRETAPPETHSAAAPIAAASVAATPAFLRRVPEPAPAAPRSERADPAMQPEVEPLRREPPEVPEPVRYAEGNTVAAERIEPSAESSEPLVQAPEPPQPQAEPEPFHLPEELPMPVAVQAPEPPQPEEPVRAETEEPVERAEQQDAVAEEAFTALFARGQGNGSAFAERFVFHNAKVGEEPTREQAQEALAVVSAPEPAAEFQEPEPVEIETEQPSTTPTAEAAPEEPQHVEEMEAAVETALAQEMEPTAEVEEAASETVEAVDPVNGVDGEGEPETAAQQAPDNDDAQRPSESLEDEMHRLLAQLTTGKR